MTTTSRLLASRLLSSAAAAALLLGSAGGASAERIGAVAAVNSEVIGDPPQADPRDLLLGDDLVLEERIESSPIGTGQFLFLDQTALTVAPNSNIVLDRFAFQFDPQDEALVPRPGPERPHHSRPDALSLNDGVLRLQVQALPGQAPTISLLPPLAGVQVVNQLGQGRGCNAQAHWDPQEVEDGLRQLRVTGRWGPGCGPHSLRLALLSDADLTARAVGALWAQAGGVLGGRVIDQPAGRDSGPAALQGQRDAQGLLKLPFSLHHSERLPLLIRDINKQSDNMASRALMLTLSPGFPARAATPAQARGRMKQWMQTRGLPAGDIEIDNGSGLSRAERGKPRAMVQLLRQAWHDRHGKIFIDSLPIAGVDGTLSNRLQNSPATGRALLKTGSLIDVRAVAGFVRSKGGRVYAVSALVNHPDAPAGTAVLDALVDWLASLE